MSKRCPKLIDGVWSNMRHPDSFEIPDQAVRESLRVGDMVKISFEETSSFGAERIWAQVTKIQHRGQRKYEGELRNTPFFIPYDFGSKVTFNAEHVIGVHMDDDEYAKRILEVHAA